MNTYQYQTDSPLGLLRLFADNTIYWPFCGKTMRPIAWSCLSLKPCKNTMCCKRLQANCKPILRAHARHLMCPHGSVVLTFSNRFGTHCKPYPMAKPVLTKTSPQHWPPQRQPCRGRCDWPQSRVDYRAVPPRAWGEWQLNGFCRRLGQ